MNSPLLTTQVSPDQPISQQPAAAAALSGNRPVSPGESPVSAGWEEVVASSSPSRTLRMMSSLGPAGSEASAAVAAAEARNCPGPALATLVLARSQLAEVHLTLSHLLSARPMVVHHASELNSFKEQFSAVVSTGYDLLASIRFEVEYERKCAQAVKTEIHRQTSQPMAVEVIYEWGTWRPVA
jgi:hypothetical protein